MRLPLRDVGPDTHVDIVFETLVTVALRDGRNVGNVLAQSAHEVEEVLAAFEGDLTTPEAQRIRRAADDAYSLAECGEHPLRARSKVRILLQKALCSAFTSAPRRNDGSSGISCVMARTRSW